MSLREQIAEAIERAWKTEAAKTPNHGDWLARKYDISADTAIAVVLAEIDAELERMRTAEQGKTMAGNYAFFERKGVLSTLEELKSYIRALGNGGEHDER